jgi:hypothetical protein
MALVEIQEFSALAAAGCFILFVERFHNLKSVTFIQIKTLCAPLMVKEVA